MRGQFNLNLSTGEVIPMRFCTWSLKRFCQLQGIGPSDISTALSGTSSLEAITNLLKSAAEYPVYKEGLTPTYTDMDICDWIDDLGGLGGVKFQEIMAALADSMNSEVEQPVTKKGKTSDVKKN